jgi:hypothetical protein
VVRFHLGPEGWGLGPGPQSPEEGTLPSRLPAGASSPTPHPQTSALRGRGPSTINLRPSGETLREFSGPQPLAVEGRKKISLDFPPRPAAAASGLQRPKL